MQTFSQATILPLTHVTSSGSCPTSRLHHRRCFTLFYISFKAMPRPSLLAILALAAGAVYANTQMGQQSEELSPQGQAAQAVFSDPLGTSPIGVGQGGPSLADALTVERRASLWFEYARDVSSIVSLYADGHHLRSAPLLLLPAVRVKGASRSAIGLLGWPRQAAAATAP